MDALTQLFPTVSLVPIIAGLLWFINKFGPPLLMRIIGAVGDRFTRPPTIVRLLPPTPQEHASATSMALVNQGAKPIYDVEVTVTLIPLPSPCAEQTSPRIIKDRVSRIPKEAKSRRLFINEVEGGEFLDWEWLSEYRTIVIEVTWYSSFSSGRRRNRWRSVWAHRRRYSWDMDRWVTQDREEHK